MLLNDCCITEENLKLLFWKVYYGETVQLEWVFTELSNTSLSPLKLFSNLVKYFIK